MTSVILKKNMLKKKIMDKRFGLFKSIVYRRMQLSSFSTDVKSFLTAIEIAHGRTERERLCVILFEYLYKTTDIWISYSAFKEVVKSKAVELSADYHVFAEYLAKFGFVCQYPKRDGVICGKTCEGLCKVHQKCEGRLKNRILYSLQGLSPDLSNIVFEYASRCIKIE